MRPTISSMVLLVLVVLLLFERKGEGGGRKEKKKKKKKSQPIDQHSCFSLLSVSVPFFFSFAIYLYLARQYSTKAQPMGQFHSTSHGGPDLPEGQVKNDYYGLLGLQWDASEEE